MEDKIKGLIAEILEVSPSDISESFGPDDAATWDSLNNLRLITAIEEESVTWEMTSFAAIRDAIARQRASS